MADSQPLSGAPEGAEYLRAVLRAPVYEAAQVTPLQKMEKLSSRLDNVILVKREDRQPVHSFKLRGRIRHDGGPDGRTESARRDHCFCG
ncbi:putative threonine dehydratase biosynthetic [Escherichia coli]|nr:putative threonine dehydratase biosynthetic [Escherichia coli]